MENKKSEVTTSNILAAIDCTFYELFIMNEPLNIFPVQKNDFIHYYRDFLIYNDQIRSESKKEILISLIAAHKNRINDKLFNKNIDFNEEYPAIGKILVSFYNWANKMRQNDQKSINSMPLHSMDRSVDINKILKNAIKKNIPDFKYMRKGAFPGVMNFSKAWHDTNLIILVDKGRMRSWIDFYIGFTNPKICFNIDDLLLLDSIFDYSTSQEAEECVAKAISILKIYLDYFEKCFERDSLKENIRLDLDVVGVILDLCKSVT